MTTVELTELLRRRIMADLHLGRTKPGGRLPSLRMVAQEFGISVRAAARAYNLLESEGLVTVRGRSGVYLVMPDAGEIALEAPLDWYAEMLREAWLRRIPITAVTMLLQQIVENPLRAACVESTTDHMEAFCSDLAEDFALETTAVRLTPEGAMVDDEVRTLVDALSDVHLIVTTAFHAADVQAVADMLKKPIVIVSVNDTIVDAVERQLETRPITIIADDPAFVDRLRETLVERFAESGELRVITLDEYNADPALTDGTTTLFTRAARKRLNEDAYHLLPPPVPFLSTTAACRVVQCMLLTLRDRMLQVA